MAGSTLRKDLVFPVAGHFLFVPYGTNGLPDMTKAYNSNKGVVVSIQRAMTLNTTPLPDGNSPYPAAEYVTTQEGTMTYVLSTYDPQLEALVAGASFEDGTSTDGEMWTIASETVPSAAEYKLTLDPRPKSKDQIVIEDMYGNKFEHEDTAPSAGSKFTYDSAGGTITFNVDNNSNIEFRAVDKAGNISEVSSTPVKRDTVPPTCTSSGESSKWIALTQTIKGTCIDSGSGT